MKAHKARVNQLWVLTTLIVFIICLTGCSNQNKLESALSEISKGYDKTSQINQIIGNSSSKEERRILTAFAVTFLIHDLGNPNPEAKNKAENALGVIAQNFDEQMLNDTFDALIDKHRFADANTRVAILLAATEICVYIDKTHNKKMGRLAHERYDHWINGE